MGFLPSNSFAQQRRILLSACHKPVNQTYKPKLISNNAETDHENTIKSLFNAELLDQAVHAFCGLQSPPSTDTCVSVLKVCLRNKALPQAKQVQAHMALHQVELKGFLGDYMVVTLARCGSPDEAWKLSCSFPSRTVFSWSAIISAYVDNGQYSEALKLYEIMQRENVKPNKYTLVGLVKACGYLNDLCQGKQLHEDARGMKCASDPFLGSTLVSMYGKCGSVKEAEETFRAISHRDVVSWTSLLSAYVEQNESEKAIMLYRQILEQGMGKKDLLSVIGLQACGLLAEKEVTTNDFDGRSIKMIPFRIIQAIHADSCKKAHTLHINVSNTLMSVYGKCGAVSEAESIFCKMPLHDVVSWNAMLSAYVEQDKCEKALLLYWNMHKQNMQPEQLTYVISLQACSMFADKNSESNFFNHKSAKTVALEIAKALHIDIQKNGFLFDTIVGTTLLGVYGKCGDIIEAENIFEGLTERNIVSWTAMLCAYVEQGHADKALSLYRQMQQKQITLDAVTFISVLQSCGELGSLETCKEIQFSVNCAGYDQSSTMQSTLVGAYGGCASMADSLSVFDGLLVADVVAWSACISGHASEGNLENSLDMFEKSILEGRKPDDVLLTSILSACSHTGLVHNGIEYFIFVPIGYDISLNLKHYGIIIDLLGRAGDLKRLLNLLEGMPMKADMAIWLSLLGSCRTHGSLELAKQAFNNVVNLQPKHPTAYVLMSNIYADANLHSQAVELQYIMDEQYSLGFG